jgi:hypothetical protein
MTEPTDKSRQARLSVHVPTKQARLGAHVPSDDNHTSTVAHTLCRQHRFDDIILLLFGSRRFYLKCDYHKNGIPDPLFHKCGTHSLMTS